MKEIVGLAALLLKLKNYFFFGAAFLAGAFAGAFFAAALGFVAAPPQPHPQPAIHLTSHIVFFYI